jgi:hypothetical protein
MKTAHRVARRLVFTFARAASRPALPAVDLPLDFEAPAPGRLVDLLLDLSAPLRHVDILLELPEPVPRCSRGRSEAAFERGAPRAGAPRGRRGKAPGDGDGELH